MTISSSLNASVAGLAANASRLATISDNIANSATYGYKRAVTDFQSLVTTTSGGTYSAGGVRSSNTRIIDQAGSLVSTNNATDLAVEGRGFLPVARASEVEVDNGDLQMLLMTTGSFRTNADGYLATESGYYLMGWPANQDGTVTTGSRDTSIGLEPVQINVNEYSGQPTTQMQIGVNLPATETDAGSTGDPQSLSVEYIDNLGTSENIDITFSPTVPGAGSSNEWTMVLSDTASGGAVIGEYVLEFSDARTGGGTLANVTTVSGGAYDPATGQLVVNVAGGPIEIDIGSIGDSSGMTQLSYSFAPTQITKDGSPVGNIAGIEVDGNGYVRALFDTGISRVVFQVPLVDLPNPNGMIALNNQTYITSPESGSFFLWDAGDGPTGSVAAFALEESATDVAGELTQLIQTQRAYSSNAKVIQTVDEMLQETTNIKR
ncbi:flagellar hook protein FlgE [Loktanella agnita]|uniref:flagellar hook protein FlgE n=1 Tax=Loktanella agnita TaxID=287097 RepID=UPI003989BF03